MGSLWRAVEAADHEEVRRRAREKRALLNAQHGEHAYTPLMRAVALLDDGVSGLAAAGSVRRRRGRWRQTAAGAPCLRALRMPSPAKLRSHPLSETAGLHARGRPTG